MGVYSVNRVASIGNIQVEAAEGYTGEIGLQIAMIEGYENDLAIFDGQIAGDFQEAAMVQEGAELGQITAVVESSIGNFVEKVKQFFVKLWEKIKGIFRGFMAKFDSVVMKDNKAFHDKYSKVVYDKDLSKMKIKYSAPKAALGNFDFEIKTNEASVNKPCMLALTLAHHPDLEKLMSDFERDEYIKNILGGCKPSVNCEPKDYAKEFHEACFEDEEEVDGVSSIIHTVGGVLTTKNPVEAVRKANTSLDKAMSNIIREIEKSKSATVKALPKDTFEDDTTVKTNYGVNKDEGRYKHSSDEMNLKGQGNARNMQKALNYIHQQATAIQGAVGMFTGATLKETKFHVAQARRVFAAAVAYNPKSVKESAELVQAAQEAAEYEVMSAFEGM